jgi:peptide deformylase
VKNFKKRFMKLPIYAYGSPHLRKISENIGPDYDGLSELIDNMFETMRSSEGVGLAAPQVGLSIRLFIVDANIYADEDPSLDGFRRVFINADIYQYDGKEDLMTEGCLSIPGIHEDVSRPPEIRIRYVDENFQEHDEAYSGMAARIIQHEYDHLDGILFTDKLSPLKKRLLKSKLRDISQGKTDAHYNMVFPSKKK